MARLSFPELDFSGGVNMSQMPYGGHPMSPLLGAAQGFMTGMEQAEQRKRQQLEDEMQRRRMQQEEMINQMRVRELEAKFEQMKIDQENRKAEQGYKEREMRLKEQESEFRLGTLKKQEAERANVLMGQQKMAESKRALSEVDPNNLDDLKKYINSTYDDLVGLGLYDQANSWMTQYGSASEEQLRLLDVENKRVASSMKSEMENQKRVLEKYIQNGYNFEALSEDEKTAIGGVALPKEKVDTVYRKALLASSNYDPNSVVKYLNGFRDSWSKSRSVVASEFEPERRLELAIESDKALDDMVEVYKMYSPLPAVSAFIQEVPDDFSSRTIDDAYIYAFEFYDKASKAPKAKKDQRKQNAAKAAEYRVAYQEMTGETIEQGQRRLLAERSAAAARARQPSANAQPQPVSASGAQSSFQPVTREEAMQDMAPSGISASGMAPGGSPAAAQDIPSFNSIQDAVAWARSPEARAYAGTVVRIRIAGKEIDYTVPRQ